MHDNETTLLQQLHEGNEAAFRTIYDMYWSDLYQAAYRRLRDEQLSEDVIQEVFYRVWAKHSQLRIQNLGAYLHQSVRNEVLDRLTRSNAPRHFYALFEAVLLENDTPEEVLRNKELLSLVARYAATLPDKRREIFLLHVSSRLDTKEIAEKLNISQKTVQNQLGTAMNGLRDQLRLIIVAIIAGNL